MQRLAKHKRMKNTNFGTSYTLPISSKQARHTLFTLILLALVSLYSASEAQAQRMNVLYQNYIRKYADACMEQMQKHKIPASITMAQGLLESGAGKSMLAAVHNNHFGIKCHSSWQGKRAYKTDDRPNECFRSYESAEDSYRDHSYFLKQQRYQWLYRLKPTNYREWAKGLQKSGYATDKGYANKLIQIIELYGLYELDHGRYPQWMGGVAPFKDLEPDEEQTPGTRHQGYFSYGLLYVLAQDGDSFESIGAEMGIKAKKLARYNDAPIDFPLKKGDIVYLEKKNHRAVAKYPDYVVKIGDSMHSIAQKFGMQVDNLYKLNNLDPDEYVPTEGDVLLLR